MNIIRLIGGMLMSNGYIINEGGDKCFIIDPGYNGANFIRTLNREGLTPAGILLTHHHSDHTGAVNEIKRAYGCPVYMTKEDSFMCNIKPDVMIEDGDVLELGELKIRTIATPGHTRGSVCFACDAEDRIFTGDTIFNVDLGRTDLEDGSYEEMCQSISEIISTWPDEVEIFPGHGDSCTMAYVRKVNREYLEITGE